ncbi:MAG: Methyltransferase type 12 [Planctomycetaceae bacterium]|nr:Methyltransferase type 12 [Planctomycetaceae bacterium]
MPLAIWSISLADFRRAVRRLLRLGKPDSRPEGVAGIAQLGHREYVGGRWEEIGRLQFEFLVQHGLRPQHVLLDVACGSLRAGVHLIPYLDRGHYWGLEKESDLIEAGLKRELDPQIRRAKEPQFLINGNFDVSPIRRPVDYLLIHSLFTHLPPELIQHCLRQLQSVSQPSTVCYVTFFETTVRRTNPEAPHDHQSFFYTRDELRDCCLEVGWVSEYLGDWGHPRGQKMLRLTRG